MIGGPAKAVCWLSLNTGRKQGGHELVGRAIQPWRLGCVHLHIAVIDPQTCQRGKNVLDQGDLSWGLPQSGTPLRPGDLIDAAQDHWPGPKVRPNEHHTRGWRSRQKPES